MACGGDLPLVAVATTVISMIVAFGYPFLVRILPRSRFAPSELNELDGVVSVHAGDANEFSY